MTQKVRENKEHKSALSLFQKPVMRIYSLLNIASQLKIIVGAFVHKAAFDPVLIQSVGVSTSRSLQFPAVYRYRLADPV